MKINQIIKEKRKQLGLTQENVAEYLGVSTPAVSKWENGTTYSLDRDDGLEHEAVFVALSPHELYERKVTMQELHAAIASLPDKQAKRIYAHFILGMTKQDIARAEGVHEKVVRVAIERGLRHLEKILKKSL